MNCNLYKAHSLLKLKYNKLDSNHNQDLPPAIIDDILYESLLKMIEILWAADSTSPYIRGFETTQQRTDFLNYYIETVDLDFLESTEGEYVGDLPDDYYHYVRAYGKDKECNKLINVDITPHQKLNETLTDSFDKPSKKWSRVIGSFRKNKLFVYSENYLSELKLQYIRIPNKHFFGGYDTLDRIADIPNSLGIEDDPVLSMDIDSKYCDLLVDFAVREISTILNDQLQNNFKTRDIIERT